jgi:hypothetical protein
LEFYHFHHAKKLCWWRKAWSMWGLIPRRAVTGGGRRSGEPWLDRSFSEPWPDLRVRGANPKMQ